MMKTTFYPRLALDGIRKNSKLYLPYMLTCILMVGIFYILSFLARSPLISYLPGGDPLKAILNLGSFVIAVFALIFLFYTNSFLIRRRKKEFGLYNVLGMTKRNIGKILLCETLLTFLAALSAGLITGILLSKLAELGLIRMIGRQISYSFSISFDAVKYTVVLFGVIFLLLFMNSMRQVRFSSAIELVRSESFGERPPKSNPILAVLGIAILAAAYWLAVYIKNPVDALIWFFVAVIMVIVATYMLFIAGSVFLCSMLRKNKSYYYNKRHFVSVSSMIYRMKRNGAGLASICILLTMVFVMISSSASLFIGKEESLKARYPQDISVELGGIQSYPDEVLENCKAAIAKECASQGAEMLRLVEYRSCSVSGLIDSKGNINIFSDEYAANGTSVDYNSLVTVHFIPLEDYNSQTGRAVSLSPGEALVSATKLSSVPDKFNICGFEYSCSGSADDFIHSGDSTADILANVYLVIPDFAPVTDSLLLLRDYSGRNMTSVNWYYGFDSELDSESQITLLKSIEDAVNASLKADLPEGYLMSCEGYEANRDDFYTADGGLFFLGILLTLVFLVAAALIIYYKQLSEGLEDCGRFTIMQNIGMTAKDIKQNINSQMLTVFFLPLVFAVIHLCFAFPLIYKLLMLFGLFNLPLLIEASAASTAVFALVYAVVYRITSNEYYAIVTGSRRVA